MREASRIRLLLVESGRAVGGTERVVWELATRLPRSRFEPYDAPYATAAVLRRAGARVAISSGDDENPRNLAFHAAMAACFGLPSDEARRVRRSRTKDVALIHVSAGAHGSFVTLARMPR